MDKPFVGILIHPWDLKDEGVLGVAESLVGLGISSAFIAVNASAEEHPPQPVDARLTHNPKRKRYVSEEGRFYYEIDPSFYPNSVAIPKRSSDADLMGFDCLRESLEQLSGCGIAGYAWLTALHNGQLVAEAGELAAVDISGKADRNWICPHNPNAVIQVLETVNEIQARYPLKGILLDNFWWKYPHTHMASLETGMECFCEHCKERMGSLGISIAELMKAVRQIPAAARSLCSSKVREINRAPTEELLRIVGLPPVEGGGYADIMNTLFEEEKKRDAIHELAESDRLGIFRWLEENPVVFEWLDLKADGLRDLLSALHQLVKANNPDFQIGLAIWSPRSSWAVCQSYRKLAPYADWLMPMTYHRLWGWYSSSVAEELFEIAHPRTPRYFASYKDVLGAWFKLAGYTSRPLRSLIFNGLPPSQIKKELVRARSLVGQGLPLYAGLQLWEPGSRVPHPEQSAEATAVCLDTDVNGVIIQAYGWAPLPNLMAASRVLEEFSRTLNI